MGGGRVRFSAPAPLPITLLAEAREHREAIAAALGLGELRPALAHAAAGGIFLRLSVPSGGPVAGYASTRPARSGETG